MADTPEDSALEGALDEVIHGPTHRNRRMRENRWIREGRERLGMTQAELAAQLDVARETVGNWETGVSSPRGGTKMRVAELLRVASEAAQPDFLFDSPAGRVIVEVKHGRDRQVQVVFSVSPEVIENVDPGALEMALASARYAFLQVVVPQGSGQDAYAVAARRRSGPGERDAAAGSQEGA